MSFFKRYQTIITALVLLFISLVVFSLTLKSPKSEMVIFRKIVLETIAPVEWAVNSAFEYVGGLWERYIFLVGLEKENRVLTARLSALKKELNSYREINLEYERLRKYIGLEKDIDYPTIAAKVVGRNRPSVFKTILINRGTKDGVSIDCPVVAAEGIAGRVIEVSWNVSKVLLLVDYNSNIDALIQRSRVQGILQGTREGECDLKYVQRSEEVKVGDVVVSSGLAGIFPKGLLLGRVRNVQKEKSGLFQRIEVSTEVDVTKLEEMLVILKEKGGSG
jgi:rod shape-determining protein MreC